MENSRNLLDKLEAKLTIRGKKAGYAGLGFMILLILTLNTLVFLRGFGNMDAAWARNIGVNLMAVAQSGRPYTRALSNTQYTIVGSYRGARLPWGFYFDIVIDKTWPIKAGKKDTYLNLALTVHNLFDIRNVTGVFAVTGNPTDNGYLTDPGTQAIINSYLDPQSYRDLYAVYQNNNTWNYSSPRTWKVSLSYNF